MIELIHGDSSKIIDSILGVSAVVTDPPYGVMLGDVDNGQSREKNQQSYDDFPDTPEYIERVVVPVISLCVSRFGRVVVTPGNRNMWKYPQPDDIGCWFVPAATSRSKWGFTCMNPILYYGKSPRAGIGDGPNSISLQATRDNSIDHPCPKPLSFMRWLVEKASMPGDTILDPFMGSGTTGVACVQLGRNFIGIEITERYYEVAKHRIKEAEKQAILALDMKGDNDERRQQGRWPF